MFSKAPANKYPYVCNATTSKNESTVSSNISNDQNSNHNSYHSKPVRPATFSRFQVSTIVKLLLTNTRIKANYKTR